MARLLSGSTLRRGGSGEFIDLAGAMPQLPATDTTLTGFSLVTDEVLRTSYKSSLGFIEFNNSSMYSAYPEGVIKVLATGTTFSSTGYNYGNLVVEGGIGVGANMYIADDIVVNGITIGRKYEGVNNLVLTGTAETTSTEFTDGQEAIVIGYDALQGITTSLKNIAIGRYALSSGTHLSNSVAIGDSSLINLGVIDKIETGLITNITLSTSTDITDVSNTNPIVVTSVDHGLTTGTQIYITGVDGITTSSLVTGEYSLVNDQTLYANVTGLNTFEIFYDKNLSQSVDGTSATQYVSSGTVSSPVLVQITGTDLTTGTQVYFENIIGTIEINAGYFYLNQLDTDLFSLYVDPILETPATGDGLTDYISDGTVFRIYKRYGNIAYGNNSGEGLIDGRENIFIGHQAGQTLNTGSFNIIIGHNKLPFLNTGSGIISIGGDNVVDGLDNQVNIGSVFYYDGQGYSYIAADVSVGLGTDSTGTSTGALIVTGGIGVSGSIYSPDGNPDENLLMYTPKVTITAGVAPSNPKVGDVWVDSTIPAYLQYIKDGNDSFWIQIGIV